MLGLRLAGAIRQDPTDPDKLTVTTVGKFLGLVMMKASTPAWITSAPSCALR